ncbi:hypothetical protein N7468_010679 [Penicillium chermesinum]|uniref:Uncharacterized protein n=1 Tax=Penicillium chermesinum TaxID=63820 RepID=A0A9W9TB01_9EURO|nr:uncharacterized protein N7468_010679 [Penicillium chermesinum]KAJ5215000.1 hypothetical protein N7468_010679 [Penicillium chermesinum]
MDGLTHLEIYGNEFACAFRMIGPFCQSMDTGPSTPAVSISKDVTENSHPGRRTKAATIEGLLGNSNEVVQNTAKKVHVLAGIRWLSSLHVLIYLPLRGTIAVKNLAELAGVHEKELVRVVRLTATCGFLQETEPGKVSHTLLSNQFISQCRFKDTSIFLAESGIPRALWRSPMERDSTRPCEGEHTLSKACRMGPAMWRQWAAFLQCTEHFDHRVTEFLTRLDWTSVGDCCIVENARVLSDLYPALQIIVQVEAISSDPGRPQAPQAGIASFETYNPQITIQNRPLGTPQPVTDAAAYILHLPPTACGSARSIVMMELHAYCTVLSRNRGGMLIATARMLPPPGTVDQEIEALARTRDLTCWQLGLDRDPEVSEVVDLVGSVGDAHGRLVVVDQPRTRDNVPVALAIKYQSWSDLDTVLEPKVFWNSVHLAYP